MAAREVRHDLPADVSDLSAADCEQVRETAVEDLQGPDAPEISTRSILALSEEAHQQFIAGPVAPKVAQVVGSPLSCFRVGRSSGHELSHRDGVREVVVGVRIVSGVSAARCDPAAPVGDLDWAVAWLWSDDGCSEGVVELSEDEPHDEVVLRGVGSAADAGREGGGGGADLAVRLLLVPEREAEREGEGGEGVREALHGVFSAVEKNARREMSRSWFSSLAVLAVVFTTKAANEEGDTLF